MARGTGPLFSLEATGSIGDALTYGKRGRANVIKRKSKPANPRTLAQIQSRAAIAATSALWRNITSSEQESWRTIAESREITLFNAFASYASANRANNLAPQMTPSGSAEPGLLFYDSADITAISHGLRIYISFATNPNEGETSIITLSTVSSADSLLPKNAVLIHRNTAQDFANSALTLFLNDMPTGSYYLSFLQGGQNGEIGITQEFGLTPIS